MLFYTIKESDIKNIPDSFNLFNLSNKPISHPNQQFVKELIPLPNESKKEYKTRLISTPAYLSLLAPLLMDMPQSNSLVIYADESIVERVGYNFAKIICKLFCLKYDYVYYKFTNCITREMRDRSVFSEYVKQKFMHDLKHEDLLKDRRAIK